MRVLELLGSVSGELAAGEIGGALETVQAALAELRRHAEDGRLSPEERAEVDAAIQRCLGQAVASLGRLSEDLRRAAVGSSAVRTYGRGG